MSLFFCLALIDNRFDILVLATKFENTPFQKKKKKKKKKENYQLNYRVDSTNVISHTLYINRENKATFS